MDRYSLSNVSYDKNGNILSLTRKGHIVADPDKNISSDFGLMDNLTYTYQANSNKLLKVSDAIVTPSAVQGEFKDDYNQTTPDPTNDYTYDANGNMKTDTNKGITNINYNHLNLPVQISINGMGQTGTITYIYDATGVKMRKTVSTGATTDYAGNYIYENGTLKFFSHPEGYVEPDGTNFDYVYQYKDHLGNIRLNYKDISTTSTPILEIIEENNYYPFGLKHKGYNENISANTNSLAQKFKYNGIELEESLGVDLYEMPLRKYDPTIARWTTLDPVVHYSMSTYNAFDNNPVFWADPSGADSYTYDWDAHERGETGIYINNRNKKSTKDWEKAITETQNALIFPLKSSPLNMKGGKYSSLDVDQPAGTNMTTFGSSRAGGKRKHAARDLYTDGSQDVLAMTTGIVIDVKAFYEGTFQVTIQHDYEIVEGSNMIIRYGELDGESINLKVGDKVNVGQVIGKTGKLLDAKGNPILQIGGQDIYMLHLELFTGVLGINLNNEPLTNRTNKGFERRGDLIDPIELLRKAYLNTFKPVKN